MVLWHLAYPAGRSLGAGIARGRQCIRQRIFDNIMTPGGAQFPEFMIDHSQHSLARVSGARGTGKFMILVWLFDLKFLTEFAAGDVGTSNRRH